MQKVMLQCKNCREWTQHEYVPLATVYINCQGCGAINYDRTSIKSVRSFDPIADRKRRPK